jgi:chemotaxis protein methyltransferase CheR
LHLEVGYESRREAAPAFFPVAILRNDVTNKTMAAGFWAPTDGSASSDRFWSDQKPAIAPELFARFQQTIHEQSGIWLPLEKATWLHKKLNQRLRELEIVTLAQYYRYLTSPTNPAERERLIETITATDTQFFRAPQQLEFLAKRLFPRWQQEAAFRKRPRRIRAWVAGCGSGEDAYSLAMLLLKFFPRDLGWHSEIVASDMSARRLEQACAGSWPIEQAAEVPGDLLQTYMLKEVNGSGASMQAGPEIRGALRFFRVNLLEERCPISGMFDLIVCRDALQFLAAESKRRAVHNLLKHLSPQGFLLTSTTEMLTGVTSRLKSLVPSIYGEVNEQGRFLYDFRGARD